MRIRYVGAVAAAVALSLIGAGAAAARPAPTSAFPWYGIYNVNRTVTSCKFVKGCANTPLLVMVFSPSPGKYVMSANYTAGSLSGDVWQSDLTLSWNGASWQGSGSWPVSTCTGSNSLQATKVKWTLTPNPADPNGNNIQGSFTNDQPANECGGSADETSAETFSSQAGVSPSWWKGNCDNGNTSTSTQGGNGGPFTSKQGAEWHGLISCGTTTPNIDPEYSIGTGPLNGDSEWQCAELAQRYLNMFFGMNNVPLGNVEASVLVDDYNTMDLAPNPGKYPFTVQKGDGPLGIGDVISYGTPTDGHVAIVTAIDPAKGTYTVIQQNWSGIVSGLKLHYEKDGAPQGILDFNRHYMPVVDWLHFTPN